MIYKILIGKKRKLVEDGRNRNHPIKLPIKKRKFSLLYLFNPDVKIYRLGSIDKIDKWELIYNFPYRKLP